MPYGLLMPPALQRGDALRERLHHRLEVLDPLEKIGDRRWRARGRNKIHHLQFASIVASQGAKKNRKSHELRTVLVAQGANKKTIT